MAMIKCDECKKEMSDKALKCPNCGCPNNPKVFCPECGESIEDNRSECPKCGYILKKTYGSMYKSRIVAGVLGIFVGSFGIHNFYLNNPSKGTVQLLMTVLSCGILGFVTAIWGLVEGVLILTRSINVDGEGNPLID